MAMNEDLTVFFHSGEFAVHAHFQAPVTGHTHNAKVILDSPTEEIFGGESNSDEYTMTYIPAELPGLRKGNSIRVDNVDYRVRGEPKMISDGRLKTAVLTKV